MEKTVWGEGLCILENTEEFHFAKCVSTMLLPITVTAAAAADESSGLPCDFVAAADLIQRSCC